MGVGTSISLIRNSRSQALPHTDYSNANDKADPGLYRFRYSIETSDISILSTPMQNPATRDDPELRLAAVTRLKQGA